MLLSLFSKPTPESLVRRLQDLPPAPKVLHTLQRLLARSDTTIEKIADLITLEPGLAARVVRMANSTQFGRGAQIDTIFEAIQRVGLKGVQELVTYAVASQLVGRPLTAYKLEAQTMWFRAVACALAAGSLAERSGDVTYDDAYTAGLMHGLGLIAIDRHVAKSRPPRTFPSIGYPYDFAPAERELLGFSHAETGAALLEMWGFSPAVTAAVRFQMDPEQAVEHRSLCMILATARWARSLLCVADEIIPDLPAQEWLDGSGVQISDFREWLLKVRVRYTVACDELKLVQRGF